MPIPDFVVELRRSIGRAALWLPGITAVVLRDDEVLLGQRSDDGSWSPITGIVELGEQPGVAAAREVLEETTITVAVERLVSVESMPLTVHVNGDQAYYLNHTFRCRYISGEPRVGDDESLVVQWCSLDELPRMRPDLSERIRCAVTNDSETKFVS